LLDSPLCLAGWLAIGLIQRRKKGPMRVALLTLFGFAGVTGCGAFTAETVERAEMHMNEPASRIPLRSQRAPR
jgi:hypothetical protein